MVEFAFAAPVLVTLILGVTVLGVAYNNYLSLTYANDNGAQLLSVSRGQATDPCATTVAQIESSAPYLTASKLGFTITINGSAFSGSCSSPPCTASGTSCTNGAADLVQGKTAQVTSTYPCFPGNANLNIYGLTPIPNCTLTAQTSVLIQ